MSVVKPDSKRGSNGKEILEMEESDRLCSGLKIWINFVLKARKKSVGKLKTADWQYEFLRDMSHSLLG